MILAEAHRVAIIASTGDQSEKMRHALEESDERYEILVFPIYSGMEQVIRAARIHGMLIYWDETNEQMETIFQSLRNTSRVPIMSVITQESEELVSKLFELGTDNCVACPIQEKSLAARYAAMLRRFWVIDHERLQPYSGDAKHATSATRQHLELILNEDEIQVLSYLNQFVGETIEHRQLCNFLWGRYDRRALMKLRYLIYSIRQKIDEEGDIIKTRWGVGYALMQPIDL